MGDDPNPETEDVHSSRIEDREPMRMASLHFGRLHTSKIEMDQAWPEEGQAQPERGYPTYYIRCVEINPSIPNLRYRWVSSKDILIKYSISYSLPHQPALVCTILLTVDQRALFRLPGRVMEQLAMFRMSLGLVFLGPSL